ncbi:MAG: Flp pilus assembly protein CpaB [Planctomycetaceae bacterium]
MPRLTPASLTAAMFGVAILLIVGYFVKHLPTSQTQGSTLADDLIPMAIADIAPGTLVTEAHLGRGSYPRSSLNPDVLCTNRVIAGRYARVAIKSNEPIHANDLLPPGETPSLNIAEGMRAMAVEIDDGAAMVGELVRANDFVDVQFTYRGRGEASPSNGLTMRLLEGVRVLALKNDGRPRNDSTRVPVLLEVSEPEVNLLTLAQDHGSITLSLNPQGRRTREIAFSNPERITLDELLGLEPVELPVITDLYRGSHRKQHEFRSDHRVADGDPLSSRSRAAPRIPAPVLKSAPQPAANPPLPEDDDEPYDDSPPPTAARNLDSPK